MKTYLQGKGYKFTENNDLKNKEFTLISEIDTINTELSVLGNVRFNSVQVWNLFLPLKTYNKAYIDSTFSDILEQNVSEFEVEATKEEQGYDLILTFTIRGV